MSGRAKRAALVVVAVVAAAQLVRPGRASPPADPSRTIEAQVGTASGLVAVLDRACNDCHANRTERPWYAQVAPLSWLAAYGASKAREAVDFSEWAAYPAAVQRQLLVESCRDASEGKMPGRAYTLLRPEARLSAHDIETICAAARQAEGKP